MQADPYDYWSELPQCHMKKVRPFHLMTLNIGSQKIKIRFKKEEDLMIFNHKSRNLLSSKLKEMSFSSIEELAEVADQKVTPKTKSMWFPYKPHRRTYKSPVWSDAGNNPKYPVFIISKGRSKRCITAIELEHLKVPFSIVVEPQEFEKYSLEFPNVNIIKTPFSSLGQGSIPVRNFVWELAESQGYKKHWIIDDNIQHFYRLHNNDKLRLSDGTCFKVCEDLTDRFTNVKISGLNYHGFCKSTESIPPFYLNTRVYSCTLIDHTLKHRWRGRFNEDTDLCLRSLKDGDCTLLLNAFLAEKVTTLRMKGGNTDEIYKDTDNRREFAESLKLQHPDVTEVVEKFGRWHHKVDYSEFQNKNKLSYKEGIHLKPCCNEYGLELNTFN